MAGSSHAHEVLVVDRRPARIYRFGDLVPSVTFDQQRATRHDEQLDNPSTGGKVAKILN